LPISIFCVLIVSALSYFSIEGLQKTIELERKYLEIQTRVGDVFETLLEVELLHRESWQNSRPPDYSERYKRKILLINDGLQALGELIEKDSVMNVLYIDLKSRVEKKLKDMDILDGIYSRPEGLRKKLLEEKGESKNILEYNLEQNERLRYEIKVIAEDIDKMAKLELKKNEEKSNHNAHEAIISIFMGSFFGCAFLLVFYYLIRIEFKRRHKVEEELIHSNKMAMAATNTKSQFVAAVGHEIRTPLNGIIGISELLISRAKDHELKQKLDIIYRSGISLLKIVNDILDFSKIEAGRIDLEIGNCSLIEVVENAIELLYAKAREKNIHILSYIDSDIPQILLADGSRISQILMNLIGNAKKFTNNGHISVDVMLSKQNGNIYQILFEITDSGAGIAEDKLDLLFKPFNQIVNNRVGKQEGTGLGLSICKSLVTLMEGEIGVRSKVGVGSTFWFSLPMKSIHVDSNVDSNIDSNIVEESKLKIRSYFDKVYLIDRSRCVAIWLQKYLSDFAISFQNITSDNSVIISEKDRYKYEYEYEYGEKKLLIVGPDDELKNEYITKFDKICLLINDQETCYHSLEDKIIYLRLPLKRMQLILLLENKGRELENQHIVEDVKNELNRDMLALIVEDNQMNQILLKAQLEELGLRSHSASNGQEAIEMWERIRYDLILMDCQMPIMDGFDACREIRFRESERKFLRATPIVAITADASKENRERCISMGMNDFLAKPFIFMDLKKIVERWSQSTSSTSMQPLTDSLKKLSHQTTPAVVKKLITSFLKTMPQTLDEMQEIIKRGEGCHDNQYMINEFSRVAHRLKSSAAILKADEMVEICEKLEKKDNLDLAMINHQYIKLKQEANNLTMTLTKELEKYH
ncbi:MAG: response regulator, partial [Oligoflexia bacterium]|nr:response regulator [Oligoflexia bacterium]